MRILPHHGRMRREFEAAAIKLAAWILASRNVACCSVVSRHDNNCMCYMAEQLDGIAERIRRQYP